MEVVMEEPAGENGHPLAHEVSDVFEIGGVKDDFRFVLSRMNGLLENLFRESNYDVEGTMHLVLGIKSKGAEQATALYKLKYKLKGRTSTK